LTFQPIATYSAAVSEFGWSWRFVMSNFIPRFKFLRVITLGLCLALGLGWALSRNSLYEAQAQSAPFKNFESPQVHPLAMTPDGTRLLAVNTPNGTLSVFYVAGNALALIAEIPVGLEPVSVTARNDNEAWLVNWLSDSVSVVDLNRFKVSRSFDVGDEPTDVVFAGAQKELAFVCVSGLSQVKVFDPASPATSPQVIPINAKQPRALVRDPAGTQVFVSIFESGNQTTTVSAAEVTNKGGPPPPSPALAAGLPAAPNVGLIVKWNGSGWADETGDARWTSSIPYTLADIDIDVVVIDAHGPTPSVSTLVRGVGTHIGNAVFDQPNNRLLVANDAARNLVRFEPNLRGNFLSTRIDSILLAGTPSVTANDLNLHIDFNNPTGSDAERANTLAMPGDLVRGADGTLYLAATSSAKVGVINSQGAVMSRIQVGQGPTGLALNESRNLLYVLNRFDEAISTVDLATRAQIATTPVGFNPEPDTVRNGRRFLYDTSLSAHGDVSCASCHPNGHRDGLAWDLGDPQGQMQTVGFSKFHPMKGPMTTQSLRGIIGTEPLHWRGDRAALSNFNPAFTSLLGGPRQLTTAEMSAFTAFVQTLTYPPNPNENLDRTLPNPATGPSATRGQLLFSSTAFDKVAISCNVCHNTSLFGSGTSRIIIPQSELGTSQDFKAPQLRGMYQKLGMANAPGEQLSGFGFTHDGSTDSLFSFLHNPVFTFQNEGQRQDIEQFMLSLDTGTAPAVGLQVTVNGGNKNSADVVTRVNLLMSQATGGNCDLVVRGIFKGSSRNFLFSLGQFLSDRQGETAVTSQTLLQTADDGAELTFMGVPVGAGRRSSIDRELNGTLDGDQPKPNAMDLAQAFVWQHYLDFLNRLPDDPGLAFWTNEITSCGANQSCIDIRRINTSGAFFRSIEFQQTGYLVERMYKAAYGDAANAVSTLDGAHNIVAPVIRFSEFIPDVKQIGNGVVVNQGNWEKQLDDNKNAFNLAFVQRARFTDPINGYPTTLSPAAFVNRLADNAGVPVNDADRTKAVNEFGAAANTSDVAARARALRDVSENAAVFNQEQNRAFVLMQYFGYLRRDPNSGQDVDYTGYDFWLRKLNQFNGNFIAAEMVKAFIISTEYRQRFGAL
jgi:DNA-binding beta-propeller fold protein YncE